MNKHTAQITQALNSCITTTNFPGKKYTGKVRDVYDQGENLLLVTTDRLTAFDRFLTAIPFKGIVLNKISAWWFTKTKHIIANHVVAVPAPNALLAKKCKIFPLEFIVRGYATGSTDTSLWTHYAKGEREYCGYELPEGLVKNQKLPIPLLTPTTKSDVHDALISADEILEQKLMSEAEWEFVSAAALNLFVYASEIAAQQGLILVDTKFEFGKDAEDNIIIADEMLTPDSSRYWLAASYAQKLAAGEEPDNFDKEIIRLWYKNHCDPYRDEVLPEAPEELRIKVAERYIDLYEMLTGNEFECNSVKP
jgi:phosphoribosylaminoimidazole-succinocarboxamide synthase